MKDLIDVMNRGRSILPLFGYYYIKTFPARVPPIRELPTSTRLVVDLAIIIPLQEIFAYYAHRFKH
jgi:hypothetical protein